jgi:hypothetical protein
MLERVEAKLDKPADQSVLTNPRGSSERMVESDTPDQAAADVRRKRANSRRRWLGR